MAVGTIHPEFWFRSPELGRTRAEAGEAATEADSFFEFGPSGKTRRTAGAGTEAADTQQFLRHLREFFAAADSEGAEPPDLPVNSTPASTRRQRLRSPLDLRG